MNDTLSREEIDEIRSRDEFDHEIGYETFPEQDRHELLAHIDAMTAAVRALPSRGKSFSGSDMIDRAAVLAILNGEHR